MKRVYAQRGVLAAPSHEVADPFRRIGTDQLDVFASFCAEDVEELCQCLLVVTFGRPYQSAGVVINDHHDVLVAALEADLIDAYAPQAVERIALGS